MTRSRNLPRHARFVLCIAGLALLAACGGPGSQQTGRSGPRYAASSGDYAPPGPPNDPWGPYIQEASRRFDMPDQWIRAVMRQESGGRLYRSNGELITSHAGAMGLMQVMPGTYDELRARYDLGADPFHPRDNIMAGTAYMREMYDIYGSPGFLAAYNAGPARLDDYLANVRGLPDETRKYVANIAPNLRGARPNNPSPAENYEMNQIATVIPPGLRYGRGAVQLAGYNAPSAGRTPAPAPIRYAELPDPAPARVAAAAPPPAPPPAPPEASGDGFSIISSANAAESRALRRPSGAPGNWAIQVGAFASQAQAMVELNRARDRAGQELAVGRAAIGAAPQARGLLYRARMAGLSRETAMAACEKISRGRMQCIVLSPEAQS